MRAALRGWDAIITDHPQPLRRPLHWHIDLHRGTVRLEAPEPYAPTLPNFRTLLDNPPKF